MGVELPKSSEPIDPMTVRGELKASQEYGVKLTINNGRIKPEGMSGRVEEYMNQIAQELSGVEKEFVSDIIDTLKSFTDYPSFVKDMVHYGPSLENDFAKNRMDRLSVVRGAVTEAQVHTEPGLERFHSTKAATFVRAHLPDLGLKTTINYLELLP